MRQTAIIVLLAAGMLGLQAGCAGTPDGGEPAAGDAMSGSGGSAASGSSTSVEQGHDATTSPATRPGSTEAAPGSGRPAPEQLGPAPAAMKKYGGISNDGTYMVSWLPDPDPIPLNEPFSITVWVTDGVETGRRVDNATLEVDGRMPLHRHGMNQVPRVTGRPDGAFAVEGMLFHMPGDWVLYFDVTRAGVTERAQFDVVME